MKAITLISILAITGCAVEGVDDTSAELSTCAGATVEGVDVSDGQGAIDWAAARGAGIEWAAIKATQGTYNTQATFAANWQHARAAGVLRGAYHFFDPREDGVAQAQHFLAVVGPLAADDLPPMLDLECPDGNSACLGWAGGTGATPAGLIRQRVIAFLDTVEQATGKRPIVYTFNAYFSSNGVDTTGLDRWPLWIAYPVSGGCFQFPAPWAQPAMWQWSWTGQVPGIAGGVDRDRFLGTREQLLALAHGASGATRFEGSGAWLSGFGRPDLALVGDFDGDHRDDIAWYEHWNGGAVTVARSTGAALVASGTWLTGYGTPDWAAAGDFDGDGKTDLVWYEAWNGGALTVLRSTGAGFVNDGAWLRGFGRPDRAFVGDFDGDGKDDLAWYEAWNDHALTVMLSTGHGFASRGRWATGIGAPDWAAAGDLDGDGKADIAWYEAWNQGAIHVLHSTGGGFDVRPWASQLATPTLGFVGDVDRDGVADVAWYQNGAIAVGRSTGAGAGDFATFVSGWGAPGWAALGDFDGDGRADVAWYELWNRASINIGLAR
ncbi:MAG: FG-GAP-like repeat-containing protein [Deltaproteobacteria bacterium]|nr:FG-GAP-like repeat-containing protein [Deltaproteobacteria bacterium]